MTEPSKAGKEFMATYTHEDCDWVLNFYAVDERDAERKITSIRRTLALDGEVKFSIKLPWLGNFGIFKRRDLR